MAENIGKPELGAKIGPTGVSFRVWAPERDNVSARIVSHEEAVEIPLHKDERGYFSGLAEDVRAGDLYVYVLDGSEPFPDPASRFQPQGVHGPSQVVDPDEFQWEDGEWKGIALRDFILYEMHVGTFSGQGTFESAIHHLDYLVDLGITAVELMPVAQFPGSRNWGYDGVYPFSPQNTYGGPMGLKKLINAAHRKGLAVVLDVVYNHFGPEGNYLGRYGPYFTDRYRTPWGEAINFDGPYSDEVRHFFIANALYWIDEFHVDALRLDAVHGIFDFSARHFLEELRDSVSLLSKSLGREVPVIAESDLNDVRIINPPEIGGYGLDAQWNDDFHHALHTLITGESKGYYRDFGRMEHLEKSIREGYVYTGQYSGYRKKRHGNSSKDRPTRQFIVFSQSHDQVGNRMEGDRPGRTQSLEKLKIAAGVVVLSPFVPLFFMGEEYGETAPFLYFVSHSDPGLARAVMEGRKKEFASFGWKDGIPNPQDEKTFLDSKLNLGLSREGGHAVLYAFYRELIRLRKKIPALGSDTKEDMETGCSEDDKTLYVRRRSDGDEVWMLFNFTEEIATRGFGLPEGRWEKVLESSSGKWGGSGERAPAVIEPRGCIISAGLAPNSFVLYRMSGFAEC